jgi:hypothetical protein
MNPSDPKMRSPAVWEDGRANSRKKFNSGQSSITASNPVQGGSDRLTPSKKRQMKKLAEKVDRTTQADRRFFERRPGRQHRVRLAGQAEIAQQELFEGKPVDQPLGCRIFAIVRNIAPGVRLRLFTLGVEGADTDLSETMARSIFEECATPYTRHIEAQMRAAVAAR